MVKDNGLTLGVLRPLSRFMTAVFFSFNRARIASDKAGFFERATKIWIQFHQCPCDPVANSASLSGVSATIHVDINIKATAGLRDFKGLHDDHACRFTAKILLQSSVVDSDSSLALPQEDPRYRGFSHVQLRL